MTVGVISEQLLEQGVLGLTGFFETSNGSPACFGVTRGGDDSAGMSLGVLQFNLLTGDLQPILQGLVTNHQSVVKTAFNYTTDPSYYNSMVSMLGMATNAEQVAWGLGISDPNATPAYNKLLEPWKTYFASLGTTQDGIDAQVAQAQSYINTAITWFNELGLWSRRGLALMFDIATHVGSFGGETPGSGGTYMSHANLVAKCKLDLANTNTTGMTKAQIEASYITTIATDHVAEMTATNYWSAGKISSRQVRNGIIVAGSGTYYGTPVDLTTYDLILEISYNSNGINGSAGLGGLAMTGLMVGAQPVAKMYLGSTKLWEGYRYVKVVGHYMVSNNAYALNEIEVWNKNGTTNYANGKTGTVTPAVDSVHSFGAVSALLNGNKTDSAYYSDNTLTPTFVIDLGQTRTDIGAIRVYGQWGYTGITNDVYLSADGTNWVTALSQSVVTTTVFDYDNIVGIILPTPYQHGWRYVRITEWGNGGAGGVGSSTLTEFQAVDASGTNWLLNKTPMESITPVLGSLSYITDGDSATVANYCVVFAAGVEGVITYDMGQLVLLDHVNVWHYLVTLGRYYNFKIEVSQDHTNWTTVIDLLTNGTAHTYAEALTGYTHTVPKN